MNPRRKKAVEAWLAALSARERKKVQRRAAEERRDAVKAKRKGAERSSVDTWVLRVAEALMRDEARAQTSETTPADAPTVEGKCVSLASAFAWVELPEGVTLCRVSEPLARVQKTALAVGDDVAVERGAAESEPMVVGVLPRRTSLSRPDPTDSSIERVIAANIDVVVIVATFCNPRFRPGLIDRYLVAAQRGGARALVVLNKADLATHEERTHARALVAPLTELGVTVLEASAETGAGIAAIGAALADTICVLVGHSGVGKSSLLNALSADVDLLTGTTRASDGRGRHTTTRSLMLEMGRGARMIDTPGIRSFGLWDMSAPELRWYFEEFDAYEGACRYPNCTHTHEPGCAVSEAVGAGVIHRTRYDSYVRLLGAMDEGSGR